MKRIVLFILLTLPFGVWGQELKLIEFDSLQHNYGKIREELTPRATHTFKFKNVSDGPVQVLDAKASCGCTTPGWEKGIVRITSEGYVMASYDTKNRPGTFDKSITVRVAKVKLPEQKPDTAAVQTIVLRIKGDVIPKPKTALDVYKFEDGNFRYTSNNFSFGTLNRKGSHSQNFTVYNAGNKKITVSKIESKPYISVKFKDNATSVNAKDSLQGTVIYDLDAVKDYEWQSERITLHTNDDTLPQKKLYLNATLLPDFSHLNPADSANFPKLKVDPNTLDLGSVKEGETAKGTFTVKNAGKKELEILKTKVSCSCTVMELPKTKLAPGEKMEVKITFDSKGKKGEQFKTLKLITNDPKASYLTLGIKLSVTEKEKEEKEPKK